MRKSKKSIKFGGLLSKVAPVQSVEIKKTIVLSAPFILKDSKLIINNVDKLPMLKDYENVYQYYFDYISYLRKNFKFYIMSELNGIKPQISGIVYNTIQGKDSFKIKGNNLTYTGTDGCISKGTWGLEPLANFYKCNNGDVTTYRFGTNISLEDNNQAFNTKIKTENGIDIIKNQIGANKILCISLISMCNNIIACNDISKYLISMKKKAEISLIEPSILDHLMEKSTDDFKVISFPLSDKTKTMGIAKIDMFNFNKYKETKTKNNNDVINSIYNLIDISSPKSTFESIVNVVKYYYDNMKEYTLCFHCKSGKDRTSVFDAVVQATIAHLRNKDSGISGIFSNSNYESIRTESQKYLWYGLQIAYYGTGFVGLKLDSIPVAKYILNSGSLYKFYSGHANSAGSSA